jgi:SulP family sulfate permease
MLATALRSAFRAGYTTAHLRRDVLAGLAVGVLAIPLAMALAIASGVPPQDGLYTSIVAGGLCALLGGSRLSVTGPTAAFVVMLAPVSAKYGLGGLALATMLAGVILIAMGVARLGRWIQFIPYPVTTGFTAGIAVVIATLQVEDFLGLRDAVAGEHFHERVAELAAALPQTSGGDAAIGVFTLLALVVLARFLRAVPGPLIAIPVAALLGVAVVNWIPGLEVATIGSRFSYLAPDGSLQAGIPALPPSFALPWNLPGADGQPLGISLELLRDLLFPAFTIALLGAIESLLCAVVADGMAGTRHDPDGELLGQGVGNFVAPFFGGFAATGAIARTATNVRAGAVSPISGVVHAVLVLLSLLLLGPLLSYVPMSSLAALLLLAAWNMSDVRHVARVLRVAPHSDKAVLLACFLLTVIFDMVVAVSVGVVLASLLFMRRMAELLHTRVIETGSDELEHEVPPGVVVYSIAGPLFFGAAEKAVSALSRIPSATRAMIFDLEAVPAMDVTGVIALESAIASLNRSGVVVMIARAHRQPKTVIGKALAGRVAFEQHDTLEAALRSAASRPGG